MFSRALIAGIAVAACCASLHEASANCKPARPRPAVVLKTMGPCDFNLETMSFAGEPVQQAMCLMRSIDQTRNIGPTLEGLPDGLASRVGHSTGLPARERLSGYLSKRDLEWDFAAYLWQPLSHARDNSPDAPTARYFVIHDTSGPNYGGRPWPDDIDSNPKINNLAHFRCADGWEVAHVIVNRSGGMLLGHELATPWRAMRFERGTVFDGALKGLFIHVELIQPRRREPTIRRRNDAQAPSPGFSVAQYDHLALIYTIASVRAGVWMIPAFHAAIDAAIPGAHDDPRDFDIAAFAASIDRLMDELNGRSPAPVSLSVP